MSEQNEKYAMILSNLALAFNRLAADVTAIRQHHIAPDHSKEQVENEPLLNELYDREQIELSLRSELEASFQKLSEARAESERLKMGITAIEQQVRLLLRGSESFSDGEESKQSVSRSIPHFEHFIAERNRIKGNEWDKNSCPACGGSGKIEFVTCINWTCICGGEKDLRAAWWKQLRSRPYRGWLLELLKRWEADTVRGSILQTDLSSSISGCSFGTRERM